MKTKRVKRLLRKYCNWWIHWMGLEYWRVTVNFMSGKHKGRNGNLLAGKNDADWKYLEATIAFYPDAMRHLTKDAIERLVCHELVHTFLNEMRESGIDHEERVTSELTKAFMWVKHAE